MKRVVKMFLTNLTLTSCATPLPYEVCKSDCFWNNVVCSESETTGYCIIVLSLSLLRSFLGVLVLQYAASKISGHTAAVKHYQTEIFIISNKKVFLIF